MRFKIICDCGNKLLRVWEFNNNKKFLIECDNCKRIIKGKFASPCQEVKDGK